MQNIQFTSFDDEQQFLNQFFENLDETVQEILDFAQETLHDFEPKEKQKAQDLLNFSKNPEQYILLKEYIFEILKAFVCCAKFIKIDDIESSHKISKYELQHPELLWVKNNYKEAVDINDLNPDLKKESEQDYIWAKERLEQWLG